MMDSVADEAKNGSAETPAAADPSTVFSALAEIIYQGSESSQIYAAIESPQVDRREANGNVDTVARNGSCLK